MYRQYDEISDALAFFYDGFKIGWQDKTGYVYGAALNDLTDKMCDQIGGESRSTTAKRISLRRKSRRT